MKDKKVLGKVESKVTESFLNSKRKDPKNTGMINYDDEDDSNVLVNKNLKSKFKDVPINSKSRVNEEDLNLVESQSNVPKVLKAKDVGVKQLPFTINYHTISYKNVFVSYLDTRYNNFYKELGTIDEKNFKIAIDDYLQRRKLSKKDAKAIETRWNETHPENPEEEESELINDNDNLLKPVESHYVLPEKEKHELVSMEKEFNKIFHELVNSKKTE